MSAGIGLPASSGSASSNCGSGLDPDITPAAAEFQVPPVAKARNLSPDKVRALVAEMTQNRSLGVLGEKRSMFLSSTLRSISCNDAGSTGRRDPWCGRFAYYMSLRDVV